MEDGKITPEYFRTDPGIFMVKKYLFFNRFTIFSREDSTIHHQPARVACQAVNENPENGANIATKSGEQAPMKPKLTLLHDDLIEQIILEAYTVLGTLGVEIRNDVVRSRLVDHGAAIDRASSRVRITRNMIDTAIRTAPSSFRLYSPSGEEKADFSGDRIHFTPGSTAINILDHATGSMRTPVTADYVAFSKIISGLDNIVLNSTALIPSDVHELVSDSYRLYLSLIYCDKPLVTGAFTSEAFEIMRDLQLVLRGTVKSLEEKPMAVFSCCPTSPLKWSDVTSQNLVDCAESMIPVEFIAMPLSGFMAPVSLVGTLIQHTAETLSGIVISQMSRPGAPMLYGGSPAIFDVRYETTPMGAIETMMIDCAYCEIGKHLGLPTQAYISFSDSKLLDAQAGLESGMGAVMAALAGINSISGPGMLDFESCQSLEKLVLDNEICGMALRLSRGIEAREDFPSLPRFRELLADKHLLISPHTRKYLKEEFYLPGPVIDRARRNRWIQDGGLSINERAHREVERLQRDYVRPAMSGDARRDLKMLMDAWAKRHGMERLPEIDL